VSSRITPTYFLQTRKSNKFSQTQKMRTVKLSISRKLSPAKARAVPRSSSVSSFKGQKFGRKTTRVVQCVSLKGARLSFLTSICPERPGGIFHIRNIILSTRERDVSLVSLVAFFEIFYSFDFFFQKETHNNIPLSLSLFPKTTTNDR
jgi:hypothetical protein